MTIPQLNAGDKVSAGGCIEDEHTCDSEAYGSGLNESTGGLVSPAESLGFKYNTYRVIDGYMAYLVQS
jgi:hypothetical protein